MKYLFTVLMVFLLACKSNSDIGLGSVNITGKWRLVSFDIPSPDDSGSIEVKIADSEPYEQMIITDQYQFEFRTMSGTMTKKDNFGTVAFDKKNKTVVFVSGRYVGNSLSYVISKLTPTELELKQQTRVGPLGRRYQKILD